MVLMDWSLKIIITRLLLYNPTTRDTRRTPIIFLLFYCESLLKSLWVK